MTVDIVRGEGSGVGREEMGRDASRCRLPRACCDDIERSIEAVVGY